MSSHATKTILLLLLAACTKATSAGEDGVGVAPPPRPQPPGNVTVELAGVTLGEDCGASWSPPPPANPPAPQRRAPPSEAPAASPSAPCAPGQDCGGGGGRYRRSCDQTSIQLALKATGTTAPTPIAIKKVELLDAKGVSLGELTARTPTRWSDAGSYQAWDQTLAPGDEAAVSYVLSTPNWDSMEGGLYGQTGKLYQVRVTVLVGAKDRVIEKKAIQAAIMPPPAPT